jgi:RNA polymerase sigma-70 factor (ECF subfamily)
LIHLYWKPLYHFARRRGNDAEKSADLVQGFFTTLIERDAFRLVDENLGKFRTFLLTAFRNFIADDHDRSSALKRGGRGLVLSLDYSGAEAEVLEAVTDTATPEQAYTREWALHVLSRALQMLEQEYRDEGNAEEFDTFRRHLSYEDEPRPSYQEMGRALGVPESVIRNRLHSARKRYACAILEVIRSSTETEEEAQEELRDLFNAFS